MLELGLLFGSMGVVVIVLIVMLLRRGTTKNTDGLLIEQAARTQAHQDRVFYNANAVHNSPPTMIDHYRP